MLRFILSIFGVFLVANSICCFSLQLILARLSTSITLHRVVNAYFILQIAGTIAMFGARLLRRQPGSGMGRPLLSLLMIWNLLLVVPTAVVFLIGATVWRLMSGPVSGVDPDLAGRTTALVFVSFPFALAFLATVVSQVQLRRFRIRQVKLTIPNLPLALRGFTIAHLSDFHVGKLTRGKVLDDIVAATNRLDVDLILLTGDLINMALEDLPCSLEILRALKSRHGLFSCEGNHDLMENRAEFEAAVKASGLSFLLNESTSFLVGEQPVQILGLRWGGGMGRGKETPGPVPAETLQRLLTRREPGDFTILLAHHPEAFDAAAEAGIPLTLAGHTHGGQLMLTPEVGFGPWLYRYWSGVYERGASRLVVSNGVGNWFPLRIHAPAEIIHLTLN